MTQNWDYMVSDEKLEDLISKYCNDFTAMEKQGRFDPITGRDKEIQDSILILLQKGRKNVCYLAGAGIGKTAMVVGLSQQINAGNVPALLKNARVIEVDLARMASGTVSKADFQDRFLPFIKATAERYHNPDEPRYIIFLDEIHQIMPGCVGSSYAGLSDTIKTYLTSGDLMVIGATTLDEFRMYVAPDPALVRRFQRIELKQPNAPETYTIMQSIRPSLEKHHSVKISNENMMLVVRLTEEHMRQRNQPDKTIITTDAAMAHHVMYNGENTEVDRESIYKMVARETGLNAMALHDEKLVREIGEEVAILEGKAERKEEKENDNTPYDPSLKVKDVEMDKEFQAELAAQQAKEQDIINESNASDEEKADLTQALEERMAAKVAERLEQKLEEKNQ